MEPEFCPICGKKLSQGEDSHYWAKPEAAHSYHTDRKSTAKRWAYRDGLDVTPRPPIGSSWIYNL